MNTFCRKVIKKLAYQNTNLVSWIPDKPYLQLLHHAAHNEKLDLKNPKTFNEKLQWLKLYDRNPAYTSMVDKCEAKKFAAERIGQEHIIPTLGVWDRVEDIDFNALPNQFVLKCTHDSGGLVICQDKRNLDIKAAKAKLRHSLKHNFFWMGREWPYKNVKPRIIAEQYMADDLEDYKFFCFQGEPRLVLVCSERFTEDGLKEDFYDEAWNHLELQRPGHPNSQHTIPKPEHFELMKKLAKKLSSTLPFSRIDFYEVEGRVYFGEITFFPASGFERFQPVGWDRKLGEWIELPNS